MLAPKTSPSFTASRNACKLCAPLGACLAFRGVDRCIPLLHGSQGCATYIRRYMISHYKEPVDIASSSFGEAAAVFGGEANLFAALDNVIHQYTPKMIGVATTCLSETIGDDIRMFLKQYRSQRADTELPVIANVSTPSYTGTHADGFYSAIRSIVESAAEKTIPGNHINLISGMISPSDIRHIKEILEDFVLPYIFLPDYSDTLDGPAWDEYQIVPEGGTTLCDIRRMGSAEATIEFGSAGDTYKTAGSYLMDEFYIPRYRMGLPVGVQQTDKFFEVLETISGKEIPQKYRGERGRLIDAYADAHKYIFDKRAILYGEEDLVVAMAGFLLEIGMVPALCASGGNSGKLRERIESATGDSLSDINVLEDVDFIEIEEEASTLKPDIVIGNSKGFKLAKNMNLPLVRVGFPIHDRIGGSRILHLGYRGTQQLFDRIVNAIIAIKQDASGAGYFYM